MTQNYKTTFNYLFSHKALPMSIFHDLDLFYQSIITSPQSLQVYLQNVLLTAKAWVQKYSPDCEPGYDVERFPMAILGDKPENSVIAINIPNCTELNDCVDIAIPFLRDHAGYFTCELSENPIDGSMMFMVGEWRPDGEGLKHINYGPLNTDNKESFIAKVIKIVYGLDYTPPADNVGVGHDRPASTSDNTEYYQKYSAIVVKGWEAYTAKDYDTALKLLNETIEDIDIYALFFQIRSQIHRALGNNLLADYDMFRAKLIDFTDTENGKELDAEIVRTMGFEPREPLIQIENYFDIIQNKDGDLLFCVRTREGEPHMSELYYSGGKNALFCRRLGQYILLEEMHETIRNEIYNSDRVLFAEFVPSEEKRDYKKDSGVIREYYVHVRFLPPAISLDSVDALQRAKLLIDAGSDVNAVTDPFCPLSLAILNGKGIYRKELVQLLLGKGANVEIAIKWMVDWGETYPENYYALFELYSGLHDLTGPILELARWYNQETALYYLQLSAEKGYAPAKRLLAEYAPPPDCAD